MAGKRSPELAAGHMIRTLEALTSHTCMDLILAAPLPLSVSDVSDIVANFISAKAHIALVLQSKTNWWQRLPWLLLGLATFDEAEAKQVAIDVLAAISSCPDPMLHHRVVHDFMPGKDLHGDFLAFVAGTPREELSDQFRQKLAEFRFVPATETTIERKHAVTTRSGRRATNVGAVATSLSNRMPILERRLQRDGVECCSGGSLLYCIVQQNRGGSPFDQCANIDAHPPAPFADEVGRPSQGQHSGLLRPHTGRHHLSC